MLRLKVTCTLLNSWLHATDSEADEGAYERFLAALAKEKKPKTRAMQMGIDFEDEITYYLQNGILKGMDGPIGGIVTVMGDTVIMETPTFNDPQSRAVRAIGNKLRGGQLQVRAEKPIAVGGRDILLVGVADALKAGILTDIKRVQRYEYGKYQHSTQHPMYMELFPEAYKFDYLIFDGAYLYRESYRRGDCQPIEQTIGAFLRYLEDAGLMDIYEKNWSVEYGV